jgi:hypothetical protein
MVDKISKIHWIVYVLASAILLGLFVVFNDKVQVIPDYESFAKATIVAAVMLWVPAIVSLFHREQVQKNAERQRYEATRHIPLGEARQFDKRFQARPK